MIIAAPPLGTDWATARARGPRRHQADAAAHHVGARTGRTAVAVADGVGDSAAAAFAARLAADHAVRVAALEERADEAVAAAHDLLVSAGEHALGDAAMVVALGPLPGTGDTGWTVAWVGDCRAYAWDGFTLRLLTRDHTVATQMRDAGITVHPRLEHVLSTSVRTAGRTEIGIVRTEAPTSLVLVSDGVHRSVPMGHVADVLGRGGSAERRAAMLVDAAGRAGTRDNATALVVDAVAVDHGLPTIPSPRVG